ncbi:BglG family transcription antiterminator [Salimicrobium halophilum]|uniref:Transcriptional antiterminator n=1 Tax=Salimicrobium halophilum TaxID=86666 RepID=A0A1G8S8E4_9BACI|nr:BglG family transcription antiterminator [Salimicrobium halophilum]SDJ25477.1 Transcriptional antiterminator [Salimicrobium halophilum]
MTLDNRRAFLLSILRDASDPIPSEELQQRMKVSERTIYYDLDHINQWLISNHLSPIEKTYGKGFELPEEAKAYLLEDDTFEQKDDWQYHYTEEERLLLLTTLLVASPRQASMKRFMELTLVSRGTVAKDLRKLKETFQKSGMTISHQRGIGYRTEGEEAVLRNHLLNLLSPILTENRSSRLAYDVYYLLYPETKEEEKDLDHLKDNLMTIIYEAEETMNLTFTDAMITRLALHLLILVKRREEQFSLTVAEAEKATIRDTDAYLAAKQVAEKLEYSFSIKVPEDDTVSIAIMLLGSKVLDHPGGIGPEKLREIVQRMVENFQTHACILFDDEKGLEENLLAHVIPAYYRLLHGIELPNELSEELQETYQDLFHLTKQAAAPLEYFLGEKLPDEEISYLSLHFGGWLHKEKKQIKTKYRAIIVCENGIGTSNMVKSQLESVIAGLEITDTLSMREYRSFDGDADVIFSTNYLKPDEIPVIHVPVIINNEDKERIIGQVNNLFDEEIREEALIEQVMATIDKHATIHQRTFLEEELKDLLNQNQKSTEKEFEKPMLNELLREDTIQFKDSVSGWEEAIRLASEPLLKKETIQPAYVDAMIESVHELGPYIVIAPDIAIPHARPEAGVNRLGMSFLRLKEPVAFSEKEKHQARLIFVLAAIDNNTHLKALAQLTEILSEEQNIKRLADTNQAQEVMKLIDENITMREEK